MFMAVAFAVSNILPSWPSAIILFELSTYIVVIDELDILLLLISLIGPASEITINKMVSNLSRRTTKCFNFFFFLVWFVIVFNLLMSLK